MKPHLVRTRPFGNLSEGWYCIVRLRAPPNKTIDKNPERYFIVTVACVPTLMLVLLFAGVLYSVMFRAL
jgi:hypothetical protein